MGYDISVRCRTKDLRNQMRLFFLKNYRFPHQVFKDKKGIDEGIPRFLTENPSMTFAQFYEGNFWDAYYDDYSIGLHYSMLSDRYRLYMHSVLCWMAIKVGRKQYFKALKRACPYIKNDAHGITPIIQQELKKSVPVTQRRFIVDQIGRIVYTPNKTISRIDLIYIKHEIKRLDMLWKKHQNRGEINGQNKSFK